jgi:adenosylcobinamide-phosphate synthase
MIIDLERQLLILAAALLLDRIEGDPDWLWRRLPHPVVIFGKAIGYADKRFNREGASPASRRLAGRLVIGMLLAASVIVGATLSLMFAQAGFVGVMLELMLVAVLLAQKSLSDHVQAVAIGYRTGGLEGARLAVSMIVGRDPATLDEQGVARAAIESLAENFSDGVVAPAFWYALLGLPGILAYKMLNTADSMIGHRSVRHIDFGRASAIADDWANWPAARLSAGLIAAGAFVQEGLKAARRALKVALVDHGLHRSPNAGWPESAMAGALDVALAGPRTYGGERVAEPMLNAAGRICTMADIDRAIRIYGAACSALLVLTVLAALTVRA